LYQSIKSSKWNANRLFGRFFDKPLDFRSLMAKHEILVAGSVSVPFFLIGSCYARKDHAIFVRHGAAAEEVHNHLTTV